jgi:hypothetical protein
MPFAFSLKASPNGGRWHPIPSETARNTVAIEPWAGGKVFERTGSGEEREWGSVTIWDPPSRVEFTWHPGASRDYEQIVTVDFRVEADETRVTLTHRGWHHSGIAVCASRFARFVSEQLLIAA